MNPTTNRTRKTLAWVAAGAAALGVGVGAAGIASAASGSGSGSTSTVNAVSATGANDNATPAQGQPPVDPATMPNGPGETLLTGDALAKATAAAQAADAGATVIRAESDSSGHTYEVHMKNADGTITTLYFDANFKADGQDTGFGPGGPGGPGHHDHVAPTSASTTAGA